MRFSARPDRPWSPPSLLYNGYGVFLGGKVGRGVLLTTHPLLVPRSCKSRAIPLPTLWATTGPVTGTLYLYLYFNNSSLGLQVQTQQTVITLLSLIISYPRKTLKALFHSVLPDCQRNVAFRKVPGSPVFPSVKVNM